MSKLGPRSCPICSKQADLPPANRWFPFCSSRCKTIDLAKWLNEEYRVPARDDEGEGGSSDGEGGGTLVH